MDIWTEKLEQGRLPFLEHWIGRTGGRVTLCDFPDTAYILPHWYEECKENPGRQDFLVLAYETPIGIAGFQRAFGISEETELYLMLGESGYNLIRTATYATLRILDRAFQDYSCVSARVYAYQEEYLSALLRMGFAKEPAGSGLIPVHVEKDVFQSRKYLF